MSSGFVEFFGINVMEPKMVHDRGGTERCLVYVGSRFGPVCVLLLEKKINNMLYVKIMLICAYVMY